MSAPRFARAGLIGLVSLLALSALSACSTFSDKPKPAELERLESRTTASTQWTTAAGEVGFALQMRVVGAQVALAQNDGGVTVRDLASGGTVWRGSAGGALSAGVGFDGKRAAVVTRGQELVVLEEGRVLWRKRLSAPVTSAPLVAGERVFVLGLDRAVDAFDALDGRYLWRLQRPGEPLALRAPGVLAVRDGLLLVGQGGRLAALEPTRGLVRWEVPFVASRGTNEVERLVDLIGPPVQTGELVCARAFESAVSCLDVPKGTLAWSRNIGGRQPVGGDAEMIVAGDGSSRVSGWRTASGELVWSHQRLLHRELTGFVAWGAGRVAAGDLQGFVHVLDSRTGQTLMRLSTDGSAVAALQPAPGGLLLVVTRKGAIHAFKADGTS